MVLKTFNVEEGSYKEFSEFCRENGFSMSKQINLFIKAQVTEKTNIRNSYLKKLELIRKGKFVRTEVDNLL